MTSSGVDQYGTRSYSPELYIHIYIFFSFLDYSYASFRLFLYFETSCTRIIFFL